MPASEWRTIYECPECGKAVEIANAVPADRLDAAEGALREIAELEGRKLMGGLAVSKARAYLNNAESTGGKDE